MKNALFKYYSQLPPWAKGLVVIVFLGIAVYLIIIISKYFKKLNQNKQFNQDYDEFCGNVKPSFPATTYTNLADKIYEAGCPYVGCVGTDEEAIYDAFKQLNTDCDAILLDKAFGTRDPRGGFCIPFTTCDVRLGQWLMTELSADSIEEINKILTSKGLTTRF